MRFFVSSGATLAGIVTLLAFTSCGDSGGSDEISECLASECGTVREGYAKGQLLAPNMDPIAGARVWTSEGSSSNDEVDESCFPAPSQAKSSDCTDSAGVFELKCDGGELEFQYVAGGVSGTLSFQCGDVPQKVRIRESAAAQLAVITGEFDRMQDVLAKLGFGVVDESGNLSQGTEYFSIYRDSDLDSLAGYKSAADLLTDPAEMERYRLIFINCGEHNPEDPNSLPIEDLLKQKAVRDNIRRYVDWGGKIYVTDQSYDFLEAAFPEFIDFLGSDGTSANSIEASNVAETGEAGLTVTASVNDELLGEWLDARLVNSGVPVYDEKDACSTKDADNVNAVMGARQADGTLLVGDFGSGWAVAEGVHNGKDVKVWMDGQATFYPDDSGIPVKQDVPLVMTFEFGDEGGRVLFTSYHTSATCSSQGFWPQERVLQYLLFAI